MSRHTTLADGLACTSQRVSWIGMYPRPRLTDILTNYDGSSDTVIRHNDIGPCGSDTFNHWADGISLSCRNSKVHDNWIVDVSLPLKLGVVLLSLISTALAHGRGYCHLRVARQSHSKQYYLGREQHLSRWYQPRGLRPLFWKLHGCNGARQHSSRRVCQHTTQHQPAIWQQH
jgi:hypothetical protein